MRFVSLYLNPRVNSARFVKPSFLSQAVLTLVSLSWIGTKCLHISHITRVCPMLPSCKTSTVDSSFQDVIPLQKSISFHPITLHSRSRDTRRPARQAATLSTTWRICARWRELGGLVNRTCPCSQTRFVAVRHAIYSSSRTTAFRDCARRCSFCWWWCGCCLLSWVLVLLLLLAPLAIVVGGVIVLSWCRYCPACCRCSSCHGYCCILLLLWTFRLRARPDLRSMPRSSSNLPAPAPTLSLIVWYHRAARVRPHPPFTRCSLLLLLP